MNILIVYAHPNPYSFSGALLKQVKNYKQEKREKWLQKEYEKVTRL
ncbi:Flavodoxin-like fold [Bacillus sp. 491mf]|nr:MULTISPECIES: NAD(P)H-dependent oxidoreductase [unclassified Bacillus (in: firmicutes)]SFC77672.1 Flavodoxin-like fold [Bacillus sp. 491mf]